MRIIRYYDNAADIIYQGPYYTALYRMILELYTKGLHPGHQFLEVEFPSVTLVNCAKTIVEETADFADIMPYLDDFHNKLSPDPKFPNPPVETICSKTYECHPRTSEQRMAVMASAYYLGTSLEVFTPNQAARFRGWFNANRDDYTHINYYLDNIPIQKELEAVQTQSQAEILEDYCLAKSVLDSVDRILPTKNDIQKVAFMEEVTESFLGDRESLHRILSGVLTARFDILEAEIRADKAANAAATSQSIASADGTKSKGATANQLALLFYYLFNELHIDFTNSDKMAWARLIHFISGHSIENLRKYLNIQFDKKSVQQDLGIVQAALQELFPAVAQKIEKDKQG